MSAAQRGEHTRRIRGLIVKETRQVMRDRRAFEPALVACDIRGIVVLSAGFSDQIYRGETAPIQVIVDGGDPNTARLVEGYLELLWANWLTTESLSRSRALLSLPISVEPQFWYNPELVSRYSLIPGSMAIILTLIGALLTALVVAREWERGTMEALLATPIGRFELLLGKIVPCFLLGMGSMFLSTLVAVLIFGVPFRGFFLVLAAISAVFMLASLGQGLLISTVTRSQLVARCGSRFRRCSPSSVSWCRRWRLRANASCAGNGHQSRSLVGLSVNIPMKRNGACRMKRFTAAFVFKPVGC